jgi:hypothetical protein
MNEELKPCAHCGSSDVYLCKRMPTYGLEIYWVECKKCEPCYTSEQAIAIWNRRVENE